MLTAASQANASTSHSQSSTPILSCAKTRFANSTSTPSTVSRLHNRPAPSCSRPFLPLVRRHPPINPEHPSSIPSQAQTHLRFDIPSLARQPLQHTHRLLRAPSPPREISRQGMMGCLGGCSTTGYPSSLARLRQGRARQKTRGCAARAVRATHTGTRSSHVPTTALTGVAGYQRTELSHTGRHPRRRLKMQSARAGDVCDRRGIRGWTTGHKDRATRVGAPSYLPRGTTTRPGVEAEVGVAALGRTRDGRMTPTLPTPSRLVHQRAALQLPRTPQASQAGLVRAGRTAPAGARTFCGMRESFELGACPGHERNNAQLCLGLEQCCSAFYETCILKQHRDPPDHPDSRHFVLLCSTQRA